MKQTFTVRVEVDAAALPTVDTVDYHLGRMAGALALFAGEYRITLSGDADGFWHGRYVPEVDDDD